MILWNQSSGEISHEHFVPKQHKVSYYYVYLNISCYGFIDDILLLLNTVRPKQNGRHFPDDIGKCIFVNGNVWISIKISPKFVLKGPINNIPALVQIMALHRPGDKPSSQPIMA